MSQTLFIDNRPPMGQGDSDLAKRVGLALNSKGMELPQVSIWATCGSVYLAGTVRSYYVRQLAISLAMHVAGVVQVVDELKVGSENSRSQCDVPFRQAVANCSAHRNMESAST